MDKQLEYGFLTEYIDKSFFDNELCRDQLRCLWTAHCLHHDIEVDTQLYDYALMELWTAMSDTEYDISDWSSYESFYNFMCRHLV